MLTWIGVVDRVQAEKENGSTDPYKDVDAKEGDYDMSSLMP